MNSSNKKSNLLVDIDVDAIVKNSLKKEITLAVELNEAYVAEPKPYKQVSEFVSQKTKDAHVELYKQHVEVLNRVSSELDTADRSGANSGHSAFRSLKLDEAYNLNAVWLHELYFANAFAPNSELYMDSKAYMKLQEAFGTFDDWQKDLIACAMSAGEGWVITGYNMFLKKIVNTIVSNNSQDVMVGLFPLVVLDIHSHAYYRDYLTDKKSHVVSIMKQLDWTVIEERFLKMESIAQVLK